MATPQDLTTTVSGRRCTRSRARTAATSTSTAEPAVVTPTEFTSTTTTSEAQQVETSAAESSLPPPPPASSTQDAEQASPTEAASSAIGTSSAVISSVAQASALADLAPSSPVAAAPLPAPEVDESQAVVSAAAVATTAPSTSPAPTSSDSIPTAVTSTSPVSPIPVLPSDSPSQSSIAALPEQSNSPLPSDSSSDTQPEPPQSTETGVPSGGSAGVISPDQGGSSDGNGLTLPYGGQTNVAGIVGGVVGGFVGIALISTLLFLCLRRRKTGTFEKWQQRISEKSRGDGGLLAKIKAVQEKLEAIPATVGMFFAKMKGKKAGPATNPYRRHSVRSSVSSVYSVRSNRRSQSISEPPSKLRQQLRGFGDRMPSLKRSRTLLQKNPDGVVGTKSPFPGIVEDPVRRGSNGLDDPFKDTEEPPKILMLLNPDRDTKSKSVFDGLQDQQRPPITPKPAAMSERGSKDPFASLLDEIAERDGSGTPEWLRETAQKHKRSTSVQTALRSHPPSTYTASVYTTAENPFFDPTEAPPVPTQPLPPNPPARPANAYAPLPAFNATSSTVSRESNTSFTFFGEPGPSRPSTNLFSSKVRQSDPFDLDRPEVLGFGNVGGRTVRASVTRQNSKSNRTSTVPNWVSVDDGPYERASAVPGPLRNPSVRR